MKNIPPKEIKDKFISLFDKFDKFKKNDEFKRHRFDGK